VSDPWVEATTPGRSAARCSPASAPLSDARLFWLDDGGIEAADSFQDELWTNCANELAHFERHAWVARTLINGRLRAARRLSAQGNQWMARQELSEALRLIEANPAFGQGDDRCRIAATYGGLFIIDPAGDWWNVLMKKYPWAATDAGSDPAAAWAWAG
jgi:hypothetical protein